MKKVVVTGASGFIGRHAIPFLLDRGYEVHGVVRNVVSFLPREVHQHPLDLLDPGAIKFLMENLQPSYLLHFAWYVTHGKFWTSPLNLQWVKASLDLLLYFHASGGKRVVMAGTCAEYDWSQGICHETKTQLNPNTLYGVCKAALFQMLTAYGKQNDLSYAWGRIFFLYGPHEPATRLVPSVIQSILVNGEAKCSHGNQIRDFLHVEDVAKAFVMLLDSEVQGGINIASGKQVKLKEVIHTIAEKLEFKKEIEFGAIISPPNEPPVIVADVDRLFNELKYEPTYPLQDGIGHMIESIRSKMTFFNSLS